MIFLFSNDYDQTHMFHFVLIKNQALKHLGLHGENTNGQITEFSLYACLTGILRRVLNSVLQVNKSYGKK